jgi:uncharacterized protein YfaS (alpha-2-macroglobulin family)
MKRIQIALLLVFSMTLLLSVNGCQQKKSGDSDGISNQDLFENLILDFTQGEISAGDPLRIVFKGAVVGSDQVDEPLDDGILQLEPDLGGVLLWENESVLRYQPSKYLYDQQIQAKLDLQQLLTKEQSKDLERDVFSFAFKTLPLDLNLVFEPLILQAKNAGVVAQLKGNLFFSAPVDSLVLEKTLRIDYPKKDQLAVDWTHDEGVHRFVISDIPREKEMQALQIQLDVPAEWGLGGKYEKRFILPEEGEFKVLGAFRNPNNDREIILSFSDLLDASQDLSGLVELQDIPEAPEFHIKNNQLSVIFRRDMEGEKTLLVSEAVKSIGGKRLNKKFEEKLFFSSPKPAVRLLSDGCISAETEKVILPFEAINLHSIDVEISKVYENNMLQFLQYSDLTEEYLPREVSEIIWQGKVELGDLNQGYKSSQWTRYGLDLMKFISMEPGALYNVKIGFRKPYTQYPCADEHKKAFEQAGNLTLPESIDGQYQTIWRGWYSYDNRKWSDRNDPCLPMYYSSDNFVQQNILASNMGLIAKYDDHNHLFVAVVDLLSGKPRSGVEVSAYSYQQQAISKAISDANGFVELEVGKKAFFLVAQEGGEIAYLKLNNYQALSMSEFDVSGKRQSEGVDGAIFAERGVWRPGDTMYIQFVLRDPASEIPEGHPVIFKLLDPSGKEYLRMTTAQHKGPFYNFTCSTDPNAKTGNWLANVEVGPRSYSKAIQIETVKPNRLKIGMTLPEGELLLGQSKMELQVDWLTGLPGAGLEVDVDAKLSAKNTRFDGYEEFVFDDVARKFNPMEMTIFRDKVDQNGQASVTLEMNKKYQYPGKLNAKFKVRAYEPSGEFSANTFSGVISPYEAYAGLAIPQSKWGSSSLKVGENYTIPLLSVDPSGKTLSNRKLTVGLYEAQWHWWWDDSGNEMARFNSDQHLMAFRKEEFRTGSDGKASMNLKLEDYGAYMIRVCDTESGHCSGKLFYAGSYGGGMDASKEFAAMLNFNAEEESYEIGQEAKLTIPAARGAQVLISLENEGKVIHKEWVRSKSEELTYSFKVSKEMFPNIYAHVIVVQGLENTGNDIPIRQYGVLNIDVSDAQKRLRPTIKMKDDLRPESDYQVRVQEEDGKDMYYTLAVVDEGLLDLTRFETPDLFDEFYARRALLTKNWDNFDDVIASKPGMMDRIISIGGDDVAEIQNDADKANRFVPVVSFLGPFHLKKNGKNDHELKMPNYSGAVRVMLVAASENAYGSAEKSVAVKDDIMVLITAPRVLSPGESIDLPVNVFVTDPSIKKVEVNLKNEVGFTLSGDRAQLMTFDQPGEKICYFNLKSDEVERIGKLEVVAKGKGALSHQNLEIQIENPNVYQKAKEQFALAPGQSKEFEIPAIGMEGSNHAIIEMSKLPALGIEERVGFLIRYPYGCIEQTTSAAFPQLYLDNLMDLSQDRKNRIKLHIIQAINRLKDFRLSDNSLSYWPGNTERSDWGSIYAAHFLVEARLKGYNTSALLPDLLDYHRSAARAFRINSGDYSEYKIIQQAYRNMVLSRAGKPQFGAMNYLFRSDKLPQLAKWYLSLAYTYAGKKDLGRQLIKEAKELSPYASNSWHYGSYLRDYSVLLMAYDEAGMQDKSAELLMRMMKIYQSSSYWNTQTLAWFLNAVGSRMKGGQVDLHFDLVIGGESQSQTTDKAIYAIELGEDEFEGKRIKVTNKGPKELFVSHTVRGKPRMGDEGESAAKYLDFAVSYFDEKGSPMDVSKLKMGTEFKAVVTLSKKGLTRDVDEMALTQIFPSGWEILNWRLEGDQRSNNALDYQDVRDDRVLSFFDLNYQNVQVEIPLHATYPGNYYLPQAYVEAMYDDDVYAKKAGKWVEVLR